MSKQSASGQGSSRHVANDMNTSNDLGNSSTRATVKPTASSTVMIDGQKYRLESLGQQGREQLQNLRATDQELQRLRDQLAITQTARNTYARTLAECIKNATPVK